jgi:DNA polymerase (family X)
MTNTELAQHLRNLHSFLTIAGYDEMQARRYIHIASEVEDLTEPIEKLAAENRLREIQGVGPSVAISITEILEKGKCAKQEEWEQQMPYSVIALLRVPGLGHKTARKLYQGFEIATLEDLKQALESGRLDKAPGIGDTTRERWRKALLR